MDMLSALQIELHDLDRLDIHILRGLTQGQTVLPSRPGVSLSFRALARKLSVSEGTVRKRVESMSSSGLLKGATVILNPSLLRLTLGTYGFVVSLELVKKEVIEQLKLIEGMMIIQNHHSNFIGLLFFYEDEKELEKKLTLSRRVSGADAGFFSVMPFPSCNISLNEADWEVVSNLIKGRFRSYKQLAADLNISARSVNRKLSRLMASNAIFTVPLVDYTAMKDSVPTDLIVFYTSPEARLEAEARVLELIDDYMFYAGFWKEEGLYSLVLPNALSATELHEKVVRIPGVSMALEEFVDERIYQLETFTNFIVRRINLINEFGKNKI